MTSKLCYFLLHNKINQLLVNIAEPPLLSGLPNSLLGLLSYPTTHSTRACHSTSYLLHTWHFSYVSEICSIHFILSFPLCVHKSVFYDCISSYPLNGFFSTYFLESIYMHYYALLVFVLELVHCIIGSRFIITLEIIQFCSFIYWWVIFHPVYVPKLLYPLFIWWTLGLLPFIDYSKRFCSGYSGTYALFHYGFIWVYAK